MEQRLQQPKQHHRQWHRWCSRLLPVVGKFAKFNEAIHIRKSHITLPLFLLLLDGFVQAHNSIVNVCLAPIEMKSMIMKINWRQRGTGEGILPERVAHLRTIVSPIHGTQSWNSIKIIPNKPPEYITFNYQIECGVRQWQQNFRYYTKDACYLQAIFFQTGTLPSNGSIDGAQIRPSQSDSKIDLASQLKSS